MWIVLQNQKKKIQQGTSAEEKLVLFISSPLWWELTTLKHKFPPKTLCLINKGPRSQMCSSNVKPIKGSKKRKLPTNTHQLKGTIYDCMPCVFAQQHDQTFLQYQQASRTLKWIGNGALQALSDRTPHNSWPSSLFTLSCPLWLSSSQVNHWLRSHGLQSICEKRFTWQNTPKTSVTLNQTKHLEK